jgi:diketogulonate reductase-like aldo/keto reductase
LHPGVQRVAKAVGRTGAQVLLRWGIQHGHVVLPKSVRRERIAENAAIWDFELTAEHMRLLDGLEENLATGWDPATQP